MIMAKSLDPKDGEVERNPKLIEDPEIEEMKLFEELNPRIMRVRKNFPNDFK